MLHRFRFQFWSIKDLFDRKLLNNSLLCFVSCRGQGRKLEVSPGGNNNNYLLSNTIQVAKTKILP